MVNISVLGPLPVNSHRHWGYEFSVSVGSTLHCWKKKKDTPWGLWLVGGLGQSQRSNRAPYYCCWLGLNALIHWLLDSSILYESARQLCICASHVSSLSWRHKDGTKSESESQSAPPFIAAPSENFSQTFRSIYTHVNGYFLKTDTLKLHSDHTFCVISLLNNLFLTFGVTLCIYELLLPPAVKAIDFFHIDLYVIYLSDATVILRWILIFLTTHFSRNELFPL